MIRRDWRAFVPRSHKSPWTTELSMSTTSCAAQFTGPRRYEQLVASQKGGRRYPCLANSRCGLSVIISERSLMVDKSE